MLEALLPSDLFSRLSEAQVDPFFDSSKAKGYTVPFYNGKTGEHIVEIPMTNSVRVSRRKMRALCSEGVDINGGEKLVSISHDDDKVTATFASGTTVRGSIVVGTDGPQSTVRHILLGDKAEAKQVGVVLYNLNVCYGDAERARTVRSLHPMNTVAIQPDKGLSVWTSSLSPDHHF
jgi:2-polyprenyl-6-methoxyphenol hydroxylase-like FAD-dependent oxidoreductase